MAGRAIQSGARRQVKDLSNLCPTWCSLSVTQSLHGGSLHEAGDGRRAPRRRGINAATPKGQPGRTAQTFYIRSMNPAATAAREGGAAGPVGEATVVVLPARGLCLRHRPPHAGGLGHELEEAERARALMVPDVGRSARLVPHDVSHEVDLRLRPLGPPVADERSPAKSSTALRGHHLLQEEGGASFVLARVDAPLAGSLHPPGSRFGPIRSPCAALVKEHHSLGEVAAGTVPLVPLANGCTTCS